MTREISIDEMLEQIPRSLGDIVRKNRHQIEISLASDADIAALGGNLDAGQIQVKDTISDWRLIATRHLPSGEVTVRFLGDALVGRGPLATSIAVCIDSERGLVRTKNSLYKLGRAGEGQPPLEHLLHFCRCLHRWGLGRILGVLEVCCLRASILNSAAHSCAEEHVHELGALFFVLGC